MRSEKSWRNDGVKRKSCLRYWKSLSRFQKTIVYIIVVFVVSTVLLKLLYDRQGLDFEFPAKSYRSPVQPVPAAKKENKSVRPNKVQVVHEVVKVKKDGGGEENEEDEDFLQTGDEEEDKANEAEAKEMTLKFGGPANRRQDAVVKAFKHAWTGYRKFAWGHDHVKPISMGAQNWFGLGLTIVDSLDTMLMMDLREEFNEARDWVANHLNLGINKKVNLFETTIRVLGGLLSAYHLSGDAMFLEKSRDLGDRLMGAFASPSGIPFSDVNLKTTRGTSPSWSTDSSTSEVSTIQLEFRDLSRITGDPKYEEAAASVSRHLHNLAKVDGLVPIYISANTGKFRPSSTITFGARGDSYYEYLVKQWIQTGKSADFLRDDFLDAMKGVVNKLARRTVPNKLLYLGEIVSTGGSFKPKMDELVCFLPGSLALAAHHGLTMSGVMPKKFPNDTSIPSDNLLMELAEELAYTCYLTFARQPTFLAAEITHFRSEPESKDDFYVKPNDAHYLLRPETIESLWYLYYVTGNKTYQDWGWNIFQGIENYTKVVNGYTTISDVRSTMNLRPKDMMESFFLGETLKYLYLLFSDRKEIDIKQWVFNTEAHPLPVRPN